MNADGDCTVPDTLANPGIGVTVAVGCAPDGLPCAAPTPPNTTPAANATVIVASKVRLAAGDTARDHPVALKRRMTAPPSLLSLRELPNKPGTRAFA